MRVVLKRDIKRKEKEYLTKNEACLFLGCSFGTVTKILESGEIPFRRVGRRIIISRENLRRWASCEKLVSEK